MKKYIVDNLANQSITGQLTIDGSLVVKGGLTVADAENFTTLTYRALLTETGPIVATDLFDLETNFIVGEEYIITDYVDGDDFTNLGATINDIFLHLCF